MADHDNRRFSRIPFDADVRISDKHEEWESRLLDISLKGALLKKPHHWTVHDNESFALTISLDDNLSVIHMDATLAHDGSDVIGFSCKHIDIDSMSHLKRLIELNLGSDIHLNRELSALVDNWIQSN